MLKFLQRIDELLLAQGHKRPWLAEQSGVNLSTINTCFNRDAYPSADKAFQIAQTLGTSVDYLMTGKSPDIFQDKDPLKNEICEYVKDATHDQMIELRTIMKMLVYISLRAPKAESKDLGGATGGASA